MRQSHDLLGHPEERTTLKHAKNLCTWRTMSADIKRYVQSCDTCQRTKSRTTLKPGEMNTLPTPTRIGQSLGMDWLSMKVRAKDPLTGKIYNVILVITDRLTRLSVFIPTTENCTAEETCILFVNNWVKRFGVPDNIISDRDPRITSEYWTHLSKYIGFDKAISSAYHPQTDGSTERVNRTALQMLRSLLERKSQSQWLKKLPELEFAYNAKIHSAIGMPPFQAAYGYVPNYGMMNPQADPLPLDERITKIMETAKRKGESIERAYNKRRAIAVKYREGDSVLLDTTSYRKNDALHNLSGKLANRYQGPYKIKEILPNETYRLELPEKSKLHNAFHTSVLKPYVISTPGNYPERDQHVIRPGPVNEGEPDIYEVEDITDHKFMRNALKFKVLWVGYPIEDATWESAIEIQEDAPDAVEAYLVNLPEDEERRLRAYLDAHSKK